ncbi:MAG TPA: putative zinc-binding metallopeptidase [Chthoniobacteraceae bacterium]|nr:putative zinc-binding metallopeptidase [Chthoniobacteraceae bacterium]
MVHFCCDNCQNVLFFENSQCLQCGARIGFDPAGRRMVTLGEGSQFQRCRNGADHQVCNWVVPKDANDPLCPSCQLNRLIPDLSFQENLVAWARMEAAKRRVLYTLAAIGLHPYSKAVAPDGLVFDFLRATPEKPVLTGHDHGVIVINLDEADDAHREKMRTSLGEPYRTLVGHFRHEIGHYYWDLLIQPRDEGDPLFQEWRALFGDERLDYCEAMQRHYRQGAPPNWSHTYISSYATMHPWEDWAETWAHYLHIIDGMETASDFGWHSQDVPIPFTPFGGAEIGLPNHETDPHFLKLVNSWAKLAPALNEIALSLGQGNLFPFVFTAAAVRKIHFVHMLVQKGFAQTRRDGGGERQV